MNKNSEPKYKLEDSEIFLCIVIGAILAIPLVYLFYEYWPF